MIKKIFQKYINQKKIFITFLKMLIIIKIKMIQIVNRTFINLL
jgi:hypothetical protein